MSSRYYLAKHNPTALIHGPAQGTWRDGVHVHRSPVATTFRMSTSKTSGGTQATQDNYCNVYESNYDYPAVRFITPPLAAQTLSSCTIDVCQFLRARFQDSSTGFGPDTVARMKVHVYITQGESATLRTTLLDNYVDTADLAKATRTWQQLASAQALTDADIEEGDCIMIELGFRIVSSPTPAIAYPPDDYSFIEAGYYGTDVSKGDGSSGLTTSGLNSWIEFSQTLTEASASAAPANDACADATSLSGSRFDSGFVDLSASADTDRSGWWTWTAPATGAFTLSLLGTNYVARIRAWKGACGSLSLASGYFGWTTWSQSRSRGGCAFNAVQGTQYWFQVSTVTNNANQAPASAGIARFEGFYQEVAAAEDDLYLPNYSLRVYREGVLIKQSITIVNAEPTGIGFDYTETPMADFNGGTHTGYRVAVGAFSAELVEILDAETLNWDGFEIDFIGDPISIAGQNVPIGQLEVERTTGLITGALMGNGFHHAANDTAINATYLNTVSDDGDYARFFRIYAYEGDDQSGAPFTASYKSPTVDAVSPWPVSRDPDNYWIYYASHSSYALDGTYILPTPLGATASIRRYNLSDDTDEVFATVTLQGNCTGIRGLAAIPGDNGLFVCNGNVVERYDSGGNLVRTYTPSVAMDSECLIDVVMTSDGTSIWALDFFSARLFKFNIISGNEEMTVNTYGAAQASLQMALYQPSGFSGLPPAAGSADCPEDVVAISTPTIVASPDPCVDCGPIQAQRLIDMVSRHLGDDERIWSETEIFDYLKRGYDEMARVTRLFFDWETLTGLNVDGKKTLTEDYLDIDRVEYDNRLIEPLTHREAAYFDARHEIDSGDVIGYTWQKDGILVFRSIRIPPADNPYYVEYWRLGTALASATDDFELPGYYARYLRDYALWKCLARRSPGQDLKLASHYKARWTRNLARVRDRTEHQNRWRMGRFGGAYRPGPPVPRPRLPWNYGKVIR